MRNLGPGDADFPDRLQFCEIFEFHTSNWRHTMKIKITKSAPGELSEHLLRWYDLNKRNLPWRTANPDPYQVWLSEIMLQQTTVATVISYFQDFLTRWPTVGDMAHAELDEILHAWQGLGYYARARNLHKCAQMVADQHAGKFPSTEDELRELPGIGPYTAAAISAIAFNQITAPVDGNIERVISRLHAIDEPVRQSKNRVQKLAARIVPADRPGDFAQALMDLGATICRPKSPKCDECPWSTTCLASRRGAAENYPVKLPKKPKPTRYGVAFWLKNKEGAVWVRKREPRGLLGGMIEIPSTEWREQAWAETEVAEQAVLNVDWREHEGEVTHTFTHFHLKIKVWSGVARSPTNAAGFWHPADRFKELALPTLMKKIVSHAVK